MRLLYSLLLYLLLPLVLLYFLWRGLREPDYLRGWGQRLGVFGDLPSQGIWLHAASVGEVQAAQPLIRALSECYPDLPLLITTFTPTGRARAQAVSPHGTSICFLPLDLPHATRQFLRRARPRLGIIIETELWPNLLHACACTRTPILLANARLTASSVKNYQRWPLRTLMQPALQAISQAACASEQDAQAFVEIGMPANRLVTTGNIKFDLALPENIHAQGQALRHSWQAQSRSVWIAASTHTGEESIVLEAFRLIQARHKDLLLVLVPRHPQRFSAVADLCREKGFVTALRSRKETVNNDTEVLLGDTLGELTTLYAAADLALVGGSLFPGIGGHNLLEPAALRLPIIVGEHLESWANVAAWLEEAGALCRADNARTLANLVSEWLQDGASRKRAGVAAARVVEQHGGAVERTLGLLPALLSSS